MKTRLILGGHSVASLPDTKKRVNSWKTDSEWVTVAFYSTFLNIHWSSVFTALFGCYMAGATWNCSRLVHILCTPYTLQPCTSLQCRFIQSHVQIGCMSLAMTCHLHFWHNDQDLLHAAAVTFGDGKNIKINQHRKVVPGEENSPAAPAGTWTRRDFSVMSLALYPLSYSCSPLSLLANYCFWPECWD